MSDQIDDFFGEPIYTYTDQQALQDGVLVAIPGDGGVNRVTRAVFDHFVKPDDDPENQSAEQAPGRGAKPAIDSVSDGAKQQQRANQRVAGGGRRSCALNDALKGP